MPTEATNPMTGGAALVAALDAWGVEVVFGIPGVHNLALYDALYEHPRIRHVTARHEGGAGFMADGYARVTGRAGVVLTTTGPAVVNALTPLAGAYAESSPVLLVASGPSTQATGESGELHEMRDQLAAAVSVCGRGRRVESVEEIPEAVAEAFTCLRTGRPRPYALEIPLDVVSRQGAVSVPAPVLPPPDVPGHDALDAAAAVLRESAKPLILAGGGAQDASRQVLALAERLDAPVGLTTNGLGVLPSDHPRCLGAVSPPSQSDRTKSPGFGHWVSEADTVLAVGTHFGQLTVRDWQTGPRRLVHVDIDPTVIGQRYPAEAALVGDAARALDMLLQCLDGVADRSAWSLSEAPARRMPSPEDAQSDRLLSAVRAALARDAVVAIDMAGICWRARYLFPVYTPRSFLCPYYSGVLGFGLPEAIGAKVACPERQVVVVCGDGGLLFTAQELAVACQEGLTLPIVVFNDNRYDSIRRAQDRSCGGRHIGVHLHNPDLVRFAESFGMAAARVSSGNDLTEALSQALAADGPSLIEVWLSEIEEG